jgi:thymidylate synthase (FAD)
LTEVKFNSEMEVELVDSMGDDTSILAAMMVSTMGETAELMRKDPKGISGRLNFLMKNRHGTPFEHGSLQFRVKAPIAVFREWHRHRIGQSYNEESGRYKKLEPEFYIPPSNRPLLQTGKPGEYVMGPIGSKEYNSGVELMKFVFEREYNTYEALLDLGWTREAARGVLGVYIYSSMYVTLNPRSLMSFLSLRTDEPESSFPSKPMWEIEQCARKMEAEFAKIFPYTYEAFNNHGRVAP